MIPLGKFTTKNDDLCNMGYTVITNEEDVSMATPYKLLRSLQFALV